MLQYTSGSSLRQPENWHVQPKSASQLPLGQLLFFYFENGTVTTLKTFGVFIRNL